MSLNSKRRSLPAIRIDSYRENGDISMELSESETEEEVHIADVWEPQYAVFF